MLTLKTKNLFDFCISQSTKHTQDNIDDISPIISFFHVEAPPQIIEMTLKNTKIHDFTALICPNHGFAAIIRTKNKIIVPFKQEERFL